MSKKKTVRCNDCGKKKPLKNMAIIEYPYRYFLCEKCIKKAHREHNNNLIKNQKKMAKKAAKKGKKLLIEV